MWKLLSFFKQIENRWDKVIFCKAGRQKINLLHNKQIKENLRWKRLKLAAFFLISLSVHNWNFVANEVILTSDDYLNRKILLPFIHQPAYSKILIFIVVILLCLACFLLSSLLQWLIADYWHRLPSLLKHLSPFCSVGDCLLPWIGLLGLSAVLRPWTVPNFWHLPDLLGFCIFIYLFIWQAHCNTTYSSKKKKTSV